jgi:tRNA1(Val) A37 N6-methylase TrmN6
MSREPYLYSEDSALLRKALDTYSGSSCLEIGAGNGGTLVELAKRFDTVVGTDLLRPHMKDWSEWGADYVISDGASCLRNCSFDLVAFNPPYLRSEVRLDRAVEGGLELEVPIKFLRCALRAVKRTGRVVMLLNDQAPIGEFEKECSISGFELRRLSSRRVFFEELAVYEAKARR